MMMMTIIALIKFRFGKTLSIYLLKGAYTRYEEQPNLLKKEGK